VAANPLARRTTTGVAARIAALKAEIMRDLGLGDDVVVSVSELACRDPGCPDLETVVALLRTGEPPRVLRIHKALSDVRSHDVVEAFRASA
jgi:hypothetical protein